MYKKILLASDGSDGALRAAKTAAVMTQQFGASLTVVSALSLPVGLAPYVGMPGVEVDPGFVVQYTTEVQDAVAKRTAHALEEAGLSHSEVKHLQEIGNPADVICRVAKEEGIDLIVLGSRGLSDFTSFFLGSVSDRVAHHAHCAILIVK